MNLYQAEQNGYTYFGVGKDESDFADHVRKIAQQNIIPSTFSFLNFTVKEITVDGYDIILRKRKEA